MCVSACMSVTIVFTWIIVDTRLNLFLTISIAGDIMKIDIMRQSIIVQVALISR